MIQTIIFDVGEVLLEYRWLEMLTDYGLSEAEASVIGNMIFADPLWILVYGPGQISSRILNKNTLKTKKRFPGF